MFLLGGVIFIIIGNLNNLFGWEFDLIKQIAISDVIILLFEFLTGCVVNLWLGWDIWDYSDLPGNILGQICPQFALVWIPISLIAILVDDAIRWKFYGEEKPRYYIFGHRIF